MIKKNDQGKIIQFNKELILPDGLEQSASQPLIPQKPQRLSKKVNVKNTRPKIRGKFVLLLQEDLDVTPISDSGIIQETPKQKIFYSIVDFGDGVDEASLPFKRGDYVEAVAKVFTKFSGFDSINYIIAELDSIVGYYNLVDEGDEDNATK